MRDSYDGLFTGIALAVLLVYLFLVMNFQSWIDPLIVLMAVPFALGGVLWMLFLTRTPMSVPALMGTLMCIGLTTANSILVVSFANQRMAVGDVALRAAATAVYTPAPGVDDCRCDDPRHGADGARHRRGRRAERGWGGR
jgi:multidrug efflux pump subunit AcrB